jgi:hypothetical protein
VDLSKIKEKSLSVETMEKYTSIFMYLLNNPEDTIEDVATLHNTSKRTVNNALLWVKENKIFASDKEAELTMMIEEIDDTIKGINANIEQIERANKRNEELAAKLFAERGPNSPVTKYPVPKSRDLPNLYNSKARYLELKARLLRLISINKINAKNMQQFNIMFASSAKNL